MRKHPEVKQPRRKVNRQCALTKLVVLSILPTGAIGLTAGVMPVSEVNRKIHAQAT